jgi:hypothetical protein
MKTNQTRYRSYFLRLWRESGAETTPWRLVMVDPYTGERQAFTEVEQLTIFIKDQIRELESQREDTYQDTGGQND